LGERGTLNSDNDTIAAGGTGRQWSLDVLGNWSGGDQTNGSVLDYTIGSASPSPGFDGDDTLTLTQHHNVASNNEILSRFVNGTNSANLEYDPAGNLIDDGDKKYIYDAFNRLAFVSATDGTPLIRYDYDALGQRIRRRVNNTSSDTIGPGDFYYYDGHLVIEYHVSVESGDTAPGDYGLDSCTPSDPDPLPPGDPPPVMREKQRVAYADGTTDVAPLAAKSAGITSDDPPAESSIDSIYASKKAATLAGLGDGGEGFTSFSIASPTGEGLTRPRSLSRERRLAIAGGLRIV